VKCGTAVSTQCSREIVCFVKFGAVMAILEGVNSILPLFSIFFLLMSIKAGTRHVHEYLFSDCESHQYGGAGRAIIYSGAEMNFCPYFPVLL
jgi:hypothetical protein